ncbi:MAG: hypothetical protein BroJett015_08620 [Chloroflexota bacterium]|nr:MAG: hypothetical protein BroJett015_08620 [Chloroflexota bacterium]
MKGFLGVAVAEGTAVPVIAGITGMRGAAAGEWVQATSVMKIVTAAVRAN